MFDDVGNPSGRGPSAARRRLSDHSHHCQAFKFPSLRASELRGEAGQSRRSDEFGTAGTVARRTQYAAPPGLKTGPAVLLAQG
eukprot:759187-Hanusia_phi.AAC.8